MLRHWRNGVPVEYVADWWVEYLLDVPPRRAESVRRSA